MIQIKNRFTGGLIKAIETLRGADLRGADLRYANLRYANLRSANLRGALGIGAVMHWHGLLTTKYN